MMKRATKLKKNLNDLEIRIRAICRKQMLFSSFRLWISDRAHRSVSSPPTFPLKFTHSQSQFPHYCVFHLLAQPFFLPFLSEFHFHFPSFCRSSLNFALFSLFFPFFTKLSDFTRVSKVKSNEGGVEE